MSKILEKKLPDGKVARFRFGVPCWRGFCEKHDLALNGALQKVAGITETNQQGDINLTYAGELLLFAAKNAAKSRGEDPEEITPEMVDEWIEELGFIDFISEAIEFAAERLTDQTQQSSKGGAKKK
jgi:hypothetical protein